MNKTVMTVFFVLFLGSCMLVSAQVYPNLPIVEQSSWMEETTLISDDGAAIEHVITELAINSLREHAHLPPFEIPDPRIHVHFTGRAYIVEFINPGFEYACAIISNREATSILDRDLITIRGFVHKIWNGI